MRRRVARWLHAAAAPIDPAGLLAFRVLFGLVIAAGAARFLATGLDEAFFAAPSTFFHFWGFAWVRPASPEIMRAVIALQIPLGVLVALGVAWRGSVGALFVLFTWVELCDVTTYLNHYYLVSLLLLLCWILPLGGRAPDARRWMLWLLRFQVSLVYVFAAVAKLNADWLLAGQPLGLWLLARTDTPLIGPWLGAPAVAMALSWGGFLYDLFIVPVLLWRRSRPLALAAVVVFHGVTGLLFPIGMFPVIMLVCATLFCEPGWPRRLGRRLATALPRPPPAARPPRTLRRHGVAIVAIWCAVQLALPMRGLLYPGPVNWHEQGMRFAWRVLVREKSGSLRYRVRLPGADRERVVVPSRYLTPRQEKDMAVQPDLVLQLAHRVAADHPGAEVRADALVSWNGRPPAPMIDPTVDLARVRDGLAPARWILPAPEGPPPRPRAPQRLSRR